MLAIALVLDGQSRTQAARQNGMERQTLRDWVHHYNESGIDSLVSRGSSGRRRFLTEGQRTALKKLVIEGPDLKVHKVVLWRCVDLKTEVERRFKVKVHESTVGRWLRGFELTRLPPARAIPSKSRRRKRLLENFADLMAATLPAHAKGKLIEI